MKQEIVTIECDICKSPESNEIRFGMMGGDYAIDLCETHMDGFKEIMRTFVDNGRKVKPMPHSVRRDKPKPIEAAKKKGKTQTERRKRPTAETAEVKEGAK